MVEMARRWVWASLAMVVLAGLVYQAISRQFSAPLLNHPEQTLVVHVSPGSHFQGLVRKLHTLSVLDRSILWRLYGRLAQPQIQAGEYRVEPGQTLLDVLEHMRQGRVELHPVTIVEGWTVSDLRRRLAAEPKLDQLTPDWSVDRLMAALDCEGCAAEGQFLPETYLFARGDSDLSILERAHQAMQATVLEMWSNRSDELPIDSPKALINLASLIEKETSLDRERAKIAGVFVRRLRLGMRLQTDPTVIYGLDESYNGDLTRTHLRTDHPWNTYTRHGLPATPIALPGRASLQAASQPELGEALYFVAKGDGSHVFSETLEAHNQAVNRYILEREQ